MPLHDIYAVSWSFWQAQPSAEREAVIGEASTWLQDVAGVGETHSALYSMLGQKGELMFLHYRKNVDALNRTERSFRRLRLYNYLRPVYSYFSVIEASLYEATAIAQRKAAEKGAKPGSAAYDEVFTEVMAKECKVLEARVFRSIPDQRYICFYPMSKRRGEQFNWYALSIEERRSLMRGHGKLGHKFSREVTQVVCGSIGLDDWEWGVSLHSANPLAIKRLVTEMRFDPASSRYAEFGPFYFAIRQQPDDLGTLLAGGLA